MCSADIPGICERVKKHLQLIKYMMFWVHAHNPCLIEVYLCYVVKLNFHRMFVIKVKKARTVIHTIKKLRKDRQAGLQQGCMYLSSVEFI